jgi:aryl-alcohol dehydrogenase-like predicted oxidoreductase
MATLNRKHIIEGVNISLNNLQLDNVDIIYAH